LGIIPIEVCRRITWAIIVDTRSFFDDIKLAEDFLEQGDYMQFPASTLEGDFMSIKHGIKIQQHNFPPEWGTPEPQYHSPPPAPYYPGKTGGGGYQPLVPPAIPPPGSFQPPPPRTPTQPYNWRPANWVDECHPKIVAVMEPLLTKYRGRCLVSNILTSGNKRVDSLPHLDAYPGGVCWLHSIATCPYGPQCSFAAGHVKKGEITDTLADEVVGAIQAKSNRISEQTTLNIPNRKTQMEGTGARGGTH